MNEIFDQLGLTWLNTIWTYQIVQSAVIALLILLGFYILGKIVKKRVFPWLEGIAQKSGNDYDDKLLAAFYRPAEWLILLTGIYCALRYLPLSAAADTLILNLFRSLIIILIAWGLYALAETDSPLSQELQRKFNLDGIIISFFSKIARFVLLSLVIVVIAQEWGYDVNGFIAGLGLGGLAFALAAKDVLANVFGGIVIILEKPFVSGDWITTSTTDGIVETITFRTTRIRAFDESLILVPNATLANEAITNNSRRGKRRVSFYLQITYDATRWQVQQCVSRIKTLLENHPEVHPETIMVFLENFNDSSLDIKVYFFTVTTVWAEHLAVREDINLRIMEILEDLGVSFAFPSHSIYIENTPPAKNGGSADQP
ncbi:MAG TPA: mechanosensitive ion channel protein [Syntrophomonas sp.]|jgi:MscS family membrane protein|nr:mechanosensitive ion channel protein [Syntrophomonas sp.]